MWTRNVLRATAFLLLLSAGVISMSGADGPLPDRSVGPAAGTPSGGPSSGGSQTLVIENCTVRFVNKSTYATARPGIIAELPFEEGDRVEPGNLVVRLRDEVALTNLKLRQQQADMETPILIAKQDRTATEMELKDKLNANRIFRTTFGNETDPPPFPKSEIERLKIIGEAKKLQVQQAQEELALSQVAAEQAEAELQTYRVHAKFTGMVTRLEKHVGEAVNLGDEIITIVDTSRVRVEGKLPYADARRLQVGDPVRVQLVFPEDRSFLFPDDRGAELDRLISPTEKRPARARLPEESEVFAGHVGFIDVESVSDLGLVNEVRIWAEVRNRDNILLEGLPAVMKVHLDR